MAANNDGSRKEHLLENFKPIIDPTMRNYKPDGPPIDPLASPDIKPGPAIGGKPGETGGGKSDAGGGSQPDGSGQGGQRS